MEESSYFHEDEHPYHDTKVNRRIALVVVVLLVGLILSGFTIFHHKN